MLIRLHYSINKTEKEVYLQNRNKVIAFPKQKYNNERANEGRWR
nr:MAG TPA: hypothetical protein [Caudoviricetes sp.]